MGCLQHLCLSKLLSLLLCKKDARPLWELPIMTTSTHAEKAPLCLVERSLPWHQSVCVESGLCKDNSSLTIALESRWLPSGDTASPVMVSVWPVSVMATSILRRSHTYNVADAACQMTLDIAV